MEEQTRKLAIACAARMLSYDDLTYKLVVKKCHMDYAKHLIEENRNEQR